MGVTHQTTFPLRTEVMTPVVVLTFPKLLKLILGSAELGLLRWEEGTDDSTPLSCCEGGLSGFDFSWNVKVLLFNYDFEKNLCDVKEIHEYLKVGKPKSGLFQSAGIPMIGQGESPWSVRGNPHDWPWGIPIIFQGNSHALSAGSSCDPLDEKQGNQWKFLLISGQ